MTPGITQLTIIYAVAAGLSVAAAGAMWLRGEWRDARALAAMLLAAAWWSACDALELRAIGVEAKRRLSVVQYLGVVSAVPFFFHAALGIARGVRPRSAAALAAIWGIPGVTLVVAFTSGWHRLLWRDVSIPDPGTNLTRYEYGPWFWVLTAHHYLLMLLGTVLLLQALRAREALKRHIAAGLLLAVLVPWIGNAAYTFKVGPWPGVNWFSVALVVSGIALAWVARRIPPPPTWALR